MTRVEEEPAVPEARLRGPGPRLLEGRESCEQSRKTYENAASRERQTAGLGAIRGYDPAASFARRAST